MVDIIIQIDRLCTYMTHEKHLKIFFVISFFDLITLLRNFHATKKSVDDIIVKNWVCRWETLLNIKYLKVEMYYYRYSYIRKGYNDYFHYVEMMKLWWNQIKTIFSFQKFCSWHTIEIWWWALFIEKKRSIIFTSFHLIF